ncbi:aminomethyltransferase family protein [Olsenella sp. kh2p3]|jgi:glycine cleavage system aminomethyltransferase T|uniref:aminomethyltransferase family protein n=1 Tax=Olsenella sp. kh2p3 TaxID=1797112 RepID=UPI00091E44EC|nr:aminomethyltransferase family protein [Olsenella sp. kh2p3]SFX01009.1 Glycine cleavage system T protein (aminomethyltransferase) [Olsenella sp. kh2p3]
MSMKFDDFNSSIVKGAHAIVWSDPNTTMMGGYYPLQYSTPKEELLAARKTAWLNVSLTGMGSFDIVGPDAVRLLNERCVNRDFSKMKIGSSRHACTVSEDGWLLGSSVLIRLGDDAFRTYCLYDLIPVIMSGKYDVKYVPHDTFIFQVDGPKSLQVVEKAFKTDFHDLKFARNKSIEIHGEKILVHRLGMTGALAYEIQGEPSVANEVYEMLLEAGEEFGLKRLGIRQYMCGGVHTPGGYPNSIVHNAAPGWFGDAEGNGALYARAGSSKNDVEDYYVTMFDMKWDYLINWDHEFVGKAALQKQAEHPARTAVTLVWDREDVGKVFAAGIYDPNLKGEGIEDYNDLFPSNYRIHVDKVLAGDTQVGVSMGRCVDYYTNEFISLGFVSADIAEGSTVEVLWGEPGGSQYRVKATVSKFPYYDGEWRNETCDVMTMVPDRPYLNA